jgi:hypothetical protein
VFAVSRTRKYYTTHGSAKKTRYNANTVHTRRIVGSVCTRTVAGAVCMGMGAVWLQRPAGLLVLNPIDRVVKFPESEPPRRPVNTG